MPQHTYEVHLTSDATGTADVESPVRTDRLDFYDSGVWAHTDDGRDFHPYEHVQVIRERPADGFEAAGDEVTGVEDSAEPAAEPETVEE